MKEIKVEWCKNFITKTFVKYPAGTGIERNLFFKMAEASGLYIAGTYGSSMSEALGNLTKVDTIMNNGEFAYNVFRLK
jgi:hypothetical protein